MKEFHVVPKYNLTKHMMAGACPCKPELRPDADTGGHRVWQHKDPKLEPPLMANGLMNGRAWTMFSVSNDDESMGKA